MSNKARGYAVLIILPVLTGVLWLASGRETLTKSARSVTVERPDDLFGGTNTVIEQIPGPRWALGYYLGLDLVAGVATASLAVGATAWLVGRRRSGRKETL